ncbi:unnamed protein product [Orchesella dallaii]|uniref:C2H2-type domain-containing protein n=1 Tax=Orchesella dallaii TaxID=48710 RepID=A0ABP1S029_9HEXA
MSEQQRNPLCVFCLKPSPHSDETAFPYLRVLSRFLNIPPDFEQKCESISKYLGSCGDCSKPCESFSKLFFEWERKGLLLTSIAGELFDIIHRSKLVPSESRALEKSFEETLNINENVDKEYAPIKEVRQVLLEHCEREVMDSFPKVTISMEDEKKCVESELKKKKKMRVKQAATVPKTRKKLIGVKRHDLKHQATSSFQAPKIKCPLCRYRTRYRGTLCNHLTHVHKRVLAYQCHSCPVKLQTVDGFRKHMLNLHSKEFKTQKMLMSAENVSYSCFDVKWVAESEEESGLGLLVLPSSSSSLLSTLSHVSEMKDGKNSTALESETGTSNSDGKATKELQLPSTSPSEEEKLPAEKDKQLGYGCKSCHKRYTNQRALGHHIVYQHKNPVDALSGK